MNSPLRISRIVERDFMRAEFYDISPGRAALIIIRGPNAAGKTSALQAIVAALGGKGYDPEMPIRDGAEGATVEITLSDASAVRFRVNASWTKGGGRYLTLYELADDGNRYKVSSPQSALNALIGPIAFDPLTFMRAAPAEQFAMLMAAIGKAEAHAELKRRRKQLYDERAHANRRLKDFEQDLRACPNTWTETLVPIPPDRITAEFNAANAAKTEAMAYENKMREHQSTTTALHNQNAADARVIQECEERITALREQIRQRDISIEERSQAYVRAIEKLNTLKAAVPDAEAINAKMQKIAEHNRQCELQARSHALQGKLIDAKHDAAQYDKGLEAIDAEVTSLVQFSDISQRIPQLKILNDDTITYNDIPISQISGMERLKTSACIGMAMNKQLRVMKIDEGDQLDPLSIEALKKLAEENNYQVWMTAIYAGTGAEGEHIVEVRNGKIVGAPEPQAEGIVDPDFTGL